MDRPILFSGPMVRALLNGRKTQTRRIIKPPDGSDWSRARCTDDCGWELGLNSYNVWKSVKIRFATGDRLWVREHWRTQSRAYDDLPPSEMDADYPVVYVADADWSTNKTVGRFRHGMHMPRWASRLTLAVTDVRVERLQAISEADALAEGIKDSEIVEGRQVWHASGRAAYAALWNQINGASSWTTNPWVVAVSFTVHRCNVDQFAAAAASTDPRWAEKLRSGEL